MNYEKEFENSIKTDGSIEPCGECGASGLTFGAFHGPNNTQSPSKSGILHFDNLGISNPPHTSFVLKLEDQDIYGSITISFALVNRRIVYQDPNGIAYEVKLNDTYKLQIMKRV